MTVQSRGFTQLMTVQSRGFTQLTTVQSRGFTQLMTVQYVAAEWRSKSIRENEMAQ